MQAARGWRPRRGRDSRERDRNRGLLGNPRRRNERDRDSISWCPRIPRGGYVATAVAASIVTEADDLDALRASIRDAVRCHFNDGDRPKVIRLPLVRDEVIAA